MTEVKPLSDEEKSALAISALEGMADAWAVEIGLNSMLDNIIGAMRIQAHMPNDVRDKFLKRGKENIYNLVTQAWIEAAERARTAENERKDATITALKSENARLREWADILDGTQKRFCDVVLSHHPNAQDVSLDVADIFIRHALEQNARLREALEEIVRIDHDHDIADQIDGDVCGPVKAYSPRLLAALAAARAALAKG